jgi:hypothetical protein
MLLKPASLMLSSISPGDPLDRMAVTVLAMDTHGRVLDDHGVLGPAEVIPAAWWQLLVDTATRPTAVATAWQPTSRRHQHERGPAQHTWMIPLSDTYAACSLEVVSDSESVKAKNLCQSSTALSHPVPSFGFAIDRRHTRNGAGALGQRLIHANA